MLECQPMPVRMNFDSSNFWVVQLNAFVRPLSINGQLDRVQPMPPENTGIIALKHFRKACVVWTADPPVIAPSRDEQSPKPMEISSPAVECFSHKASDWI